MMIAASAYFDWCKRFAKRTDRPPPHHNASHMKKTAIFCLLLGVVGLELMMRIQTVGGHRAWSFRRDHVVAFLLEKEEGEAAAAAASSVPVAEAVVVEVP